MDRIIPLRQAESVRLDVDRLDTLYVQLGEDNAEDVVCRAIEELAIRLTHCSRMWQDGDRDKLRKGARSLVAIADQVGMSLMAKVARDVMHSIDAQDAAATAATLARLLRVGEQSLTAVWDQQGLTI